MQGKKPFGYNEDILKLIKRPKTAPKITEETREEEELKELEVKLAEEEKPKEIVPYVTFSGIRMTEDGQLTKGNFLKKLDLDPEQYQDVKLTPQQAKKVERSLKSMSAGISSVVPMTCTGPQCGFKNTCPLFQAGAAPVARACPIEAQLLQYWIEQYITEFDVDFNSPTEVRMVSEIAEFDVYEMRVTKYLAENHQNLLQDVTIYNMDGSTSVNTEISKAFDLKERIKRNRMKVLDALVATRKDKVKIVSETIKGNSTAERINELKAKIDSITGDIKKIDYVDVEVVNI